MSGVLDPPALTPTRGRSLYGGVLRMAIWGDSLAKYGEGIDPYIQGSTMCAVQFSGPEVQKRVYSHPGQDTGTMLASTGEITSLSPAPDAVLVQGGTNDVIAAIATSTIIANLTEIYRRFEARGIRVIMTTIPPLGGPFAHNGKQGPGRKLNVALRLLAASSGRMLVDPWSILVDPATQRFQTAYDSGDNVHPNTTGLIAWAAKVVDDLAPLIGPAPTVTELSNGSGDNLFPNAGLLTGGGNLAGSADAGLALGFGATNSIAGITTSLVPDTGPVPFGWQTFTLSGAAGNQLFYQAASSALTAGHKMAVSLRYRRTAGTAGAVSIFYSCYHGGTVDLNVPILGSNGASGQMADSAHLTYLTVPAGATNGQLQINLPTSDGVFAVACPTIYDLTAMGLA